MFRKSPTLQILLLLVFGAPFTANAQTSARFSVEPSEARVNSGFGFLGEKFTFTAEVPQANCYALDFGDDPPESPTIKPGASGKAEFVHRYEKPGGYTAVMQAWRTSECVTEVSNLPPLKQLSLRIRVNPFPAAPTVQAPPPPVPVQLPAREIFVQAAPPAVSQQWPPLRPLAPIPARPAEPAESDFLLWLLVVAAIALLRPGGGGVTAAEGVTFEMTRDRGRGKVNGSPTADEAVALRVSWRHEPQFAVADDAVLLGVRPGPDHDSGS